MRYLSLIGLAFISSCGSSYEDTCTARFKIVSIKNNLAEFHANECINFIEETNETITAELSIMDNKPDHYLQLHEFFATQSHSFENEVLTETKNRIFIKFHPYTHSLGDQTHHLIVKLSKEEGASELILKALKINVDFSKED
jgi:hypothetical protein